MLFGRSFRLYRILKKSGKGIKLKFFNDGTIANQCTFFRGSSTVKNIYLS